MQIYFFNFIFYVLYSQRTEDTMLTLQGPMVTVRNFMF